MGALSQNEVALKQSIVDVEVGDLLKGLSTTATVHQFQVFEQFQTNLGVLEKDLHDVVDQHFLVWLQHVAGELLRKLVAILCIVDQRSDYLLGHVKDFIFAEFIFVPRLLVL